MNDAPQTPFFEQHVYRRRRSADAARMLPILGFILFALPMAWRVEGANASTSVVGLYLFCVSGFLVFVSAVLARRLRPADGVETSGSPLPADTEHEQPQSARHQERGSEGL
ncbi:MAG: hypothetical protein AAGD04_07525 [Pseudomonadota bacterium]